MHANGEQVFRQGVIKQGEDIVYRIFPTKVRKLKPDFTPLRTENPLADPVSKIHPDTYNTLNFCSASSMSCSRAWKTPLRRSIHPIR